MKLYRFLVSFGFLACSLLAKAQTVPNPLPNAPGEVAPKPADDPNRRGKILDDSTQQIYGPTTSRYFLEEDLFNNRKTLYAIDTNYINFHRFDYLEHKGRWYTDLGVLSSALRPLYFTAPQQIGAQLGYDVNSPYAITPYDVKYYDTKSPFTQAYFVQGGNGQSILQFDLSRNVNSQWNIGLHVERNLSRRQISVGSAISRSDRDLGGFWNFVMHSNYRTKDEKYTVLGHFRLYEHSIREPGGIYPETNPARANWDSVLADPASALQFLTASRSRERRNQFHVYQEYVPVKGFQVYHVGDYINRFNRYRDRNYQNSVATGFYNNLPERTTIGDTIQAQANYWLLENKIGLKGALKGFNYRVHLRRRDYGINQRSRLTIQGDSTTFFTRTVIVNDSVRTLTERFTVSNPTYGEQTIRRRNENFLGAWLAYYFKDSTRIEAEGEYLIGADYRLHADYYGKWFKATFTSTLNSPTLIQERFLSPLVSWSKNFDNVFTNQITASAPVRIKNFFVEPSLQYSLTKNYIYYDTESVAQQENSAISMYLIGVDLGWRAGKFSTSHQAFFTTTSGPDLIRMPKVLTRSKFAFDFVYSKVMYVQVGLDAHYRMGYYADFYQPLSNQFYLNNTYKVPGFLVVDAFADIRINRVRVFVQFKNVADGLLSNGYMPTPYYPGMKRGFGFGVCWPLFD
ncbi:putative porin [Siphonobacter sp.]|uniref:putative porin n=1 Tax=Siphonobacter sp. TaxID=1869184 RepID=UPI003B3B4221